MNTLAANFLASFASAFSQSNRLLKLRFGPNAGITDDALLPWKLTGDEAINERFHYELTALSADAFIPLKELIGQPLEVSVLTDSGESRPINGWVTQARQDGSDGGMSRYALVFEDLFSVLDKRVNNRVFQDLSAKDAWLAIVREHQRDNPVLAASLNIDDRTARDYPIQSWITQYNESDTAFGQRKLREEGINFFFQHGGGTDQPTLTLVLFDDNAQLEDNPAGSVRYHRADGSEDTDTVTAWHGERTLAPAQIAAASYDYKPVAVSRPQESSRLDQGEAGNDLASTLEDYRHDLNHYGNDADDYSRYTALRMQAVEQAAKHFGGASTVRAFTVGTRFTLKQHPEIDAHDAQDRQFILTRLVVNTVNNLPGDLLPSPASGTAEGSLRSSGAPTGAPLAGGGVGGEGQPESVFTNTFTAQRDTVPLVPAYRNTDHAKPAAPQLLTATVVGPAGEEIHTDSLGRVRVNLHFPRAQDHESGGANRNETDSVWMRVAQAWAGAEYGALFIPRVGDEVIVGFINGDIDRPIVTGTVYNGTHRPASFSHTGNLPGNKTLSGIKSKMYKGNGANELVLDDTTQQLRARLATDHGHTALNQGYLVHPRNEGKGAPRGEGFELRTDKQGAIRAAQGLLISTDARSRAHGKQLDRQELVGQLDAALAMAKQLAELSDTHHADNTDTQAQDELLHHLKAWEQGTNTASPPSPASGTAEGSPRSGGAPTGVLLAGGGAGGEGQPGRKPIIAVSAPAGLALSTPQDMTLTTGTHLDLITEQDTHLTLGQKLKIRAAESISLFAHKLGIKVIAAKGKIDIQAQADNIEATAAKKILLTALEEIVIQAPKITHTAQGAGVEIGQGNITTKTVGAHTEHAGKHNLTGAAAPVFTPPGMPQSELKTDEKFVTSGRAGQARENLPYELAELTGKILGKGSTAEDGGTEVTKDSRVKPLKMTLKDE